MKFRAYTDGACNLEKINGTYMRGYGGSACVLLKDEKIIKEFSESFQKTTNNEMELYSILRALYETYILEDFDIKSDSLTIYSDSNYAIKAITVWSESWIKNNWRNSKNEIIKNLELIKTIIYFTKKFDNLKFVKVKGHADNKNNNRADKLAVQGKINAKNNKIDTDINTLLNIVNKIIKEE